MLETELQTGTLYADPAEEQELTPVDHLRQQWNQQPGPIPLIKQKNVIDQNAELLPWAGMAAIPGWTWPFAFALQGLVLLAVLASFVNWLNTRHSGKLEDEIAQVQANVETETRRQQGIADATEAEIRRISRSAYNTFTLHMSARPLSREEALQQLNASLTETRNSLDQFKQHAAARERELRAREGALALANSGTPLIFTLALVLAAGSIGASVRRAYSRNPHARNAADFYLYSATAEGLYLNLVFIAFLHFGLSASAWGFSDFSQTVGPIFWALFWMAFYFLLLWYFVTVARDMYQALQLRPTASEWSLGNSMLLRIHNNFLMIFVALELPYLGACYLLYRAGR